MNPGTPLQSSVKNAPSTLTPVERAWSCLASEVLLSYIKSGCNPRMDSEWFDALCHLSSVDPGELRKKLEFIYGPEED